MHQDKIEFMGTRGFLICKCCHWCASFLTSDCGYISLCPVCGSHEMEWLPISYSESYRLDHDPIRGVVLDFWATGQRWYFKSKMTQVYLWVREILRAPVKQFFRFLKGRNCKCGHGLGSHSETGKCTSHIGFVSACPCSLYEQYPKQT